MIAAALRGALSDRARDGKVHVISDLVAGDAPSTKAALSALAAVASSDKVLVVLHRDDDLAWLSLRNVVTVHALAVDQLNAYDVLVNDEVVFTSSALEVFVAGPVSGRSAEASAEPSNAELAAAAATVAEVLEPTQDVVEVAEVGEPDEVAEVAEVADVAEVAENEGDAR
jgi:large subunit ribosomal protein L4